MTQQPPILTTEEAAKMLGVAVETFRRWARSGAITPVQYPRRPKRWLRDDVLRLMNKRLAS